MKRIDLKHSPQLHKMLKQLHSGSALILTHGKEERYAILPMEDYENLQNAYQDACIDNPLRYGIPGDIRVMSNEHPQKISLAEYEKIKQQLLQALEKNLKPDEQN